MPESSDGKYFEHEHLVTFEDTNSVGNVYFARYFQWMGKCRELVTLEHYPEIVEDMRDGFGFATEYAHVDYVSECFLFDKILIRMRIADITRNRIEFSFEYLNHKTGDLVATGRQAVVWVNSKHRASIMPDKLYDSALEYLGRSPE